MPPLLFADFCDWAASAAGGGGGAAAGSSGRRGGGGGGRLVGSFPRRPGGAPTPGGAARASSGGAVTRLIGPERCELFSRNARASVGGLRQRLDELGKCDDAHTGEAVLLLDLLHGGARAAAALLTVERECDADRLAAGG